MDVEEWRPIDGFPNYEVSNQGNIRSIKFNKIKILKLQIDKQGYYSVNLCTNNITRRLWVARLVGIAFIPNPENKPEIDHINRIRTDNRVENLRWVSHSENCINTVRPNRLGHKYISKHKTGEGYNVQSKTHNMKKYFLTLQEAIAYRDSLLLHNTPLPSPGTNTLTETQPPQP